MKIFNQDVGLAPIVVAEIGVNHEGCLDKAKSLLLAAVSAGADAVKFQTYTPSRYASSSDKDRLSRVTNFALKMNDFRELRSLADDNCVGFFSTPLSEDVISELDQFVDVFKIASGDLTFEPVIKAVAKTGKPMILSTGLGTVDEIDQAVEWVSSEIGEGELTERLILMHCVSAYPTPVEQASIRSVPFLKERYGLSVGYSNHVIGPEACLAATALGADIIEVHFTDSKIDREFRDHELSFDADDLKDLVFGIQKVYRSLGEYSKVRQEVEKPMLEMVRKGLVAARNISKNSILRRADIMFARPATEFSAGDLEMLIGKRLLIDLEYGQLISKNTVE